MLRHIECYAKRIERAYLVDFRILVGEHAFELWLEQPIDCSLGHDVGVGAASFHGVQSGSGRRPRANPPHLKRVVHVLHQPIAKFSQDLLLTLEPGAFVRVLVSHLRKKERKKEEAQWREISIEDKKKTRKIRDTQ